MELLRCLNVPDKCELLGFAFQIANLLNQGHEMPMLETHKGRNFKANLLILAFGNLTKSVSSKLFAYEKSLGPLFSKGFRVRQIGLDEAKYLNPD